MKLNYKESNSLETRSNTERTTYSHSYSHRSVRTWTKEEQKVEDEYLRRQEERERVREQERIKKELITKTEIFASEIVFNKNSRISYDNEEIYYTTKNKSEVAIGLNTLKSFFYSAEALKFHEGLCQIQLVELSSKEQKLTLLKRLKLKLQLKSKNIKKQRVNYVIKIIDNNAYRIYLQNSVVIDNMIYGYCNRKDIDVISLSASRGSLEIAMVLMMIPGSILAVNELFQKIREFIIRTNNGGDLA